MIAWDRIAQLRDEIGENDFQEIVTLFLDEVDEGIDQLAPDLTGAALAQQLHFLAGSALNLGFEVFARLCQAGERGALDTSADKPDLAVIARCYTMSRRQFIAGLADPVHLAG